jgi:hypothetical protein
LSEGGSDDAQRLQYAVRLCIARTPNEAEQKELLGLLERQTKRGESGEISPHVVAGVAADQKDLPGGASAAQLAGWTAVSRVLLNLDETITKE